METIIGDYIGTSIRIHSAFPTKNQTGAIDTLRHLIEPLLNPYRTLYRKP